MADKYPGVSPYAYCAWNPVRLVDPDGCDTLCFSSNGYYQMTKKGGEDLGIVMDNNGQVSKEFIFADNRWCNQFVKMDDTSDDQRSIRHGYSYSY